MPLRVALRHGDFWRLWCTFAICGATTNGLIGTHLIPHAIDQGLSAVAAATTLAMMGVLDIAGTLGSGWLSDRYDKRVLLAAYYGLRGLALLYLPYADDLTKLVLFGVVYGLDWIATVPPTGRPRDRPLRDSSGPILFGLDLLRPSGRRGPGSLWRGPAARLVGHLPRGVYHGRAAGPRRGRPCPHHAAGAAARADGLPPPDVARRDAGRCGRAWSRHTVSPHRTPQDAEELGQCPWCAR